jgi:hypothetical protein
MVCCFHDSFALLCFVVRIHITRSVFSGISSQQRNTVSHHQATMSYQSPSLRRTAEATPLPDSPAGDQPGDDDKNNSNNNTPNAKTSAPSPEDFTESLNDAKARARLCLRFMNIANTFLESSNFYQRSLGDDNPSEESRDSTKAQKRQWYKDILQDEGATGLNAVLKVAFLFEAEAELRRLVALDQAEATEGARLAWQNVSAMVQECRALRQEVDRVMGQFK